MTMPTRLAYAIIPIGLRMIPKSTSSDLNGAQEPVFGKGHASTTISDDSGSAKLQKLWRPTTMTRQRLPILSMVGYTLMRSYINPFATACCTVATPSLRFAFSV